ncbi:MAG: TRAP transporter substrate-binding protein DctP [Verrucomicrobia bacterium]|nr:TRAP transporter substrate-binding protein DctP [Verrucomicrobiota bacterium]
MQRRIDRKRLVLALAIAWTATTFQLSAAPKAVTLRLGTLAPRGTSYHKSLMFMREQWLKASQNTVRLTVFSDGTQGSEADMVGLMQTGNLDAGMLTAVGLAEIERAITALQNMPMSFRSLTEVDYVGAKLQPQLEQRLLAKGYIVLFWSDSGWVRFFSKKPMVRPDDLRKFKLFSWAGDVRSYDLWKASGYNPVALETAGIAQGLMSDTINVVPLPPFFALAGQLYDQTPYMLELNWAPLVGATVVRKSSWERIPADLRTALLQIAAETGRQIKTDGRAESDAAVAAMVKRGLTVTPVTPAIEAEWRAAVDAVRDQIRERMVPADMYDEAQRHLKEFRAARPAASK